jgi:drug/metabolite transporter (DMT)-like permease
VIALAGCIVCWGAVPVMLRYLTGSIDAWTANAVRYPLSAVLFWPVLWVCFRSDRLTWGLLARCLLPGLLAFVGQVLWATAPYYLPASMISFFIRLAFVWSMLAAMAIFADERRLLGSRGFYVGVALCSAGFIALSWSKMQEDDQVTTTGVVIMLGCSLVFGLYGVAVRGLLRNVHPLLAFGVVSQIVSIGTLILLPLYGDVAILGTLPRFDWFVLAASSVMGIAMGHFFMYTAVQDLGPTITSAVGTTGPFITVILAGIFLGEHLTLAQWSAGITIIIGALLLLRVQDRLARI